MLSAPGLRKARVICTHSVHSRTPCPPPVQPTGPAHKTLWVTFISTGGSMKCTDHREFAARILGTATYPLQSSLSTCSLLMRSLDIAIKIKYLTNTGFRTPCKCSTVEASAAACYDPNAHGQAQHATGQRRSLHATHAKAPSAVIVKSRHWTCQARTSQLARISCAPRPVQAPLGLSKESSHVHRFVSLRASA
jgi:hypothetical protein